MHPITKPLFVFFLLLCLTTGVGATTTVYGEKGSGSSKYVVVAPHAAGDDLYTKELTKLVASQLRGSYVINTEYPKEIEDFNMLSWSNSQQSYLWSGKDSAMVEFYSDITKYVANGDKIVIFIHGMKDKPDTEIDIGIGAMYYGDDLLGTVDHPDAGSNTGDIMIDIGYSEQLASELDSRIGRSRPGDVTIGEYYAAWSSKNGIQYFRDSDDQSVQLEISYSLRKKPLKTSRAISSSFRSVFG